MQKLSLLFLSILMLSCTNSPEKNYARLSGSITDSERDSITIRNAGYSKSVALKPDGTFNDTLKISKGLYTLIHGNNKVNLFLEKGYNLRMHTDADSFLTALRFRGKGSDNNNFIRDKVLFVTNGIGELRNYYRLDKQAFNRKVDSLRRELQKLQENRQLDPMLVQREENINQRYMHFLRSNYKQQHEIESRIVIGKSSPKFQGFENYEGGITSFDDLPDGYLYFMIWSTECSLCRKQFDEFNSFQKKYGKRNITFVGISVDEKLNHEAWEQTVRENKLQGIQLHSPKGYYTGFIRNYNITETPRYILVDPQGNIVNAYAPAPSDKLKKIFEDQGII